MDDNNEENSEFCKQTAAISAATSAEISSDNFFSNFLKNTALVEEYDKIVIPEDSENLIKLEQDEKDELGPIVDTPFRVRCYTWPRHHQCMQGHFKVIKIADLVIFKSEPVSTAIFFTFQN